MAVEKRSGENVRMRLTGMMTQRAGEWGTCDVIHAQNSPLIAWPNCARAHTHCVNMTTISWSKKETSDPSRRRLRAPKSAAAAAAVL